MNQPFTIIFFGKSGSGKGTQAALLLKSFERLDAKNRSIYIETGQGFRDLIDSGDSFVALKTKEVLDAGTFMPPFMPIWSWTQSLVHGLKTGKEHLVFDGVCRRAEEAPLLDGALQFLGRVDSTVILLDVHHDVVTDRLIKRGRYDDKQDKIVERLKAFETNAMPSVDYFKKSPNVRFVEIDGDQPIEKVHEDVLKAIGVDGRI